MKAFRITAIAAAMMAVVVPALAQTPADQAQHHAHEMQRRAVETSETAPPAVDLSTAGCRYGRLLNRKKHPDPCK